MRRPRRSARSATPSRKAKAAHQTTSAKLLAEIVELEATRRDMSGDVDLLDAHLEEQRLRLRTSIDELQRLLDSPDGLRVAPVPAQSGRVAPVTVEPDTEPAPESDVADAGKPARRGRATLAMIVTSR